jgi:hypothetical protein
MPLQDVWLLAVLRGGVLLLLFFLTTPGSTTTRAAGAGLGSAALRPPTASNHEQVMGLC